MTVAELIAALQQCEPNRRVHFFVDWQHQPEVNEISREDVDGRVMLAHDMPAEMYVEDYKEERG